jgi:hypothetical protein
MCDEEYSAKPGIRQAPSMFPLAFGAESGSLQQNLAECRIASVSNLRATRFKDDSSNPGHPSIEQKERIILTSKK